MKSELALLCYVFIFEKIHHDMI